MKKLVTSIALLTTIIFTSSAQNQASGWAAAHNNAHKQEQLATNKSRLDISVIEAQRNQEILEREAMAEGLTGETAILVNDLLEEAESHLGKKYVFGSKGPKTFDCSGFTGYVYREFGYSIGASSRDQYTRGKSVDVKNARKGDLIFFTSRSSGKNVGHVGIVWDVDPETGKLKFIHSSTGRGVIISDFEGYYVKRYVGIKRIIDED